MSRRRKSVCPARIFCPNLAQGRLIGASAVPLTLTLKRSPAFLVEVRDSALSTVVGRVGRVGLREESAAAVHLPFNELESMRLALDLAVAPALFYRCLGIPGHVNNDSGRM